MYRPDNWDAIKNEAFHEGKINPNAKEPGVEFEAGADAIIETLRNMSVPSAETDVCMFIKSTVKGKLIFIPDD